MEGTWCLFTLVLLSCFTKANCEDLVDDECKYEPTPCGNNAQCFNTDGHISCECKKGYKTQKKLTKFTPGSHETCRVINECLEDSQICGLHANCTNSQEGYFCSCKDGYVASNKKTTFQKSDNVTCNDFNECEKKDICGLSGTCHNTIGSYFCVCGEGFIVSPSGKNCEDVCVINHTICGNGTCHHGASGHYCKCNSGFSNYGNVQSRCTRLNCDIVEDMNSLKKDFGPAYNLTVELTDKCKERETPTDLKGEVLLERLLSVIDKLLSGKFIQNNREVSTFLNMVEAVLGFIGPFTTPPEVNKTSNYTDLVLHLHKGSILPKGLVTLSLEDAKLDIQMETVAGDPSQYSDFAAVSLLSIKNLDQSANYFFEGVKKQEKETFQIISKVVSITVSNKDTKHLKQPVIFTLHHLQQVNQKTQCVFWDSSMNGGAWSTRGCQIQESNPNFTVCSCDHLSSFAVLMALYKIEDTFELQLITWIGLSLSLICLSICVLTFGLIRSIQSQRTKIHLHLSISLFLAFAIFLVGISRTENQVGCAVVAGLLHFFFLASFCWMCLEGIQLFRMVVLVFNTSFRTVYLMAAGYGVPAVIVSISALANAKGYGTERYCWLRLDSIWSFFGPACIIIFINIIFFLITVWKLAQKFSSLNPDLDNLQKVKTFTITAVAQLCLLGIMWIFGCFQFEEKSKVMSYLFTIFASMQGVLLFVMHCLFSKQIRDEYRNILVSCCAPQKKTYSEFGYTYNKAQASRSTQDTGGSNI